MCNPKKYNILEIRRGFATDEAEIVDINKFETILPPNKPE